MKVVRCNSCGRDIREGEKIEKIDMYGIIVCSADLCESCGREFFKEMCGIWELEPEVWMPNVQNSAGETIRLRTNVVPPKGK